MKQDGVQVDEIILSSQVMEVCWTHALSNEKEVIKGIHVYLVKRTVMDSWFIN